MDHPDIETSIIADHSEPGMYGIAFHRNYDKLSGSTNIERPLSLDDLEEIRDTLTEFLNKRAVSEYLAATIGEGS